MLNHEWMRQRDRRIRQGARETEPVGEDPGPSGAVAVEPERARAFDAPAELPASAPPADAPHASPPPGDAVHTQDARAEAASSVAAAEEVGGAGSGESASAPWGVEKAARPTRPETQARQVVERIEVPVAGLRDRLQSVLAHQVQLPLDIEARRAVSERAEGSPRETRQALVQRLLDPTLTLEEVAVLLGVCRTTVRRYTDRGVLRCFRTPGNQRRFHLTDVLDFMEHQTRAQ